jgi:nitroreductase/FMN reductase [NAD(P)H]
VVSGASIAELIERRFGLAGNAGAGREADGALQTLLAHGVCRSFRPEPVSEETLQIALSAAFSAPSKSDLQQVSLVMFRDPAQRRAIEALMPSMPWIAGAPLLMVFCGDNRRIRRIAAKRGKPHPNDTLDMFMNAAVDSALVMQAFIVAAESLGLGCCPLSLIRNQVEELSALLALPANVFPVAGLAAGHPAAQGRTSMRLPLSLTVHTDRYDDAKLDAELAAYDARRAAREPIAPAKQRLAERYGTLSDYGWSEDKARQYSTPERHNFGPYIRKQGFALE